MTRSGIAVQGAGTEALPAYGLEIVAQLLSRAERGLTRQLGDLLEDCSVEQWRALMLLADGVGHPMSDLADFVMIPGPSLTRLVDRMVSDSLVYRKADPRDRRRVLVHITVRGEALRQRLARRIERVERPILTQLATNYIKQLAAVLAESIEQTP